MKYLLIVLFLQSCVLSSEPSSSDQSENNKSVATSGYGYMTKLYDWWHGHYCILLDEIRANKWSPDIGSTDDIHRAERAIEGGIKKDDPDGLSELLSFCTEKRLPLNHVYLEKAQRFFLDKLEQEKKLGAEQILQACKRLQNSEERYLRAMRSLGIEEEPRLNTTAATLKQLHKANLLN